MKRFKKNSNNLDESISFQQWVDYYYSPEKARIIFVNIDKTMKYLHDRDFTIDSFNPARILLLDNSVDKIKFLELSPMPDEYMEKNEYIRDDIQRFALLQVGIYSKALPYLSIKFVKENFDSFIMFLPSEDVSYFREVIGRGRSLYFSIYDLESRKYKYNNMVKEEVRENGGIEDYSLDNSSVFKNNDPDNKKVNDKIYNLDKLDNAAYINYIIIPIIISIVGIILIIVSFI